MLRRPAGEFERADLEFHAVDHSRASFEARIFLNSADATLETPADIQHGYGGSFFVFGHGGCAGDEGHCDVPTEPRRPYDLRPEHQLTRGTKRVTITDALRRALGQSDGNLAVTIVPVVEPEDAEDYSEALLTDLLDFERVALLTYGK
jgi:hypothetical protein